ncbi:46531_t:CDS:2 [Gigaspora margarita]|uniref:46531_t:CDS:1 n=1 Tax=Gigaspora margarita TaxID=4874 RepID=A0ABM8VWB5_GIGMA|nr:46531_t:CDS:2 [Gigaspora margarita]
MGWPALDVPPPNRADFTAKVDLKKVRNAPLNLVSNIANGTCPTSDAYCYYPCSKCIRPDDILVCPTVNDWGLTFDDGPTNDTIAILDLLKSYNLKITFFVVGSRVVSNSAILLRAFQEGHQIGVHTWSHHYLTTQSTEEVIAELEWGAEIIKNVTGVRPLYMRPPFGDYDDRIRDIATQLGYKVAIWDKDSSDWHFNDTGFDISWIASNFTAWMSEKSTTGHISLEHDLFNVTAKQAPIVVDILMKAKRNIKPVADCLGYPAAISTAASKPPPTVSSSVKSNSGSSTSSTPTPANLYINLKSITSQYNYN